MVDGNPGQDTRVTIEVLNQLDFSKTIKKYFVYTYGPSQFHGFREFMLLSLLKEPGYIVDGSFLIIVNVELLGTKNSNVIGKVLTLKSWKNSLTVISRKRFQIKRSDKQKPRTL